MGSRKATDQEDNGREGGWRHLVNGAAVSASTAFVSISALVTVLGADNRLEPAHAIPIGGIIPGTASLKDNPCLEPRFPAGGG